MKGIDCRSFYRRNDLTVTLTAAITVPAIESDQSQVQGRRSLEMELAPGGVAGIVTASDTGKGETDMGKMRCFGQALRAEGCHTCVGRCGAGILHGVMCSEK